MIVEKVLTFLLKAYGIDTLNPQQDATTSAEAPAVSCDQAVRPRTLQTGDAKKLSDADMERILSECTDRYAVAAMPEKNGNNEGVREQRDARAFVMQPNNLKLMLPSLRDNLTARANMVAAILRALPLWLSLVVSILGIVGMGYGFVLFVFMLGEAMCRNKFLMVFLLLVCVLVSAAILMFVMF